MAPGILWTAERDGVLRRLHAKGLSARRIAIELSCGLSRNAVIGRIHRLGLSLAARPKSSNPQPRQAGGDTSIAGRINRKRQQEPVRPPPRAGGEPPAELPAEAIPRRPQRQRKKFFDLQWGDCRYPYGEQSFVFCAAEALPGRPYCDEHFALCFPRSSRAA